MSKQLSPKDKTEFHKKNGTNKCGYLGIKYRLGRDRYEAWISVPWKKNKVFCGSSKTADGAARCYDRKARELFKQDAVVNFSEE